MNETRAELAKKIRDIAEDIECQLDTIQKDIRDNRLSFATAEAICLVGYAQRIKEAVIEFRNVEVYP